MKVCGTDEAGRGPVIGPLVMCGVLIDEKDEEKLVNIGVKDSKMLTPDQRDRMFDRIKLAVEKYEIIILTPQDIDAALEDPSTNLNWLEADCTAKILNTLQPDKAILDCPSTNTKAYQEYVEKKLEKKMEIISEHQADANYPVAAAASILAKVTRDREIVKLQQQFGDLGSGYPSDPKTKKFLEANWNVHPEIFRKTWKSYKDLVTKKNQKGLGDF